MVTVGRGWCGGGDEVVSNQLGEDDSEVRSLWHPLNEDEMVKRRCEDDGENEEISRALHGYLTILLDTPTFH